MDHTTTIDNLQFIADVFEGHDPAVETPVVCAFRESPEAREEAGKGWPAYRPEDAAIHRAITRKAVTHNTFYSIATVDTTQEKRLKRTHTMLKGVWAFPLDDIGTGGGSKYKPSTVPLPPSFIIETSKDNYQYVYLPDVPVRNPVRAQALIKAMAEEHGDKGGSLAGKYVRLPVGYNNKPARCIDGEPFPVRMVEYHPDRRYTLEEMMKAFDVDPELMTEELIRTEHRRTKLLGWHDSEDAVFDWMRKTFHVASEVDGEGWCTITCPWCDEHTTGGDTARYSPRGYGGDFAGGRQFKCFHGHCADRGTADLLDWVLEQGGPNLREQSLSRYLERYTFVEKMNRVLDTDYPLVDPLPLKYFHDARLNESYLNANDKLTYYSKEWQAHTDRRTTQSLGFHPGGGPTFKDSMTGATMANTFQPALRGAETEDEDLIQPWLDQLAYLFGEDELEHALEWIALTTVRPWIKLPYALLHISLKQGTGRGWLKQLFDALFGLTRYHRTANIRDLQQGGYNEWIYQSLLVTFDEVYERGNQRYTMAEQLRELVTEKRVHLNVKYGFKGDVDVFCNFLFLSNHLAAMNIPDADRRLWVVLHDQRPRSDGWYKIIYDLLDDEAAVNQMRWYLDRIAKQAKVRARAPITQAKELVQISVHDNFEDLIRDAVDDLIHNGVEVLFMAHLEKVLLERGLGLPLSRQEPEYRRVLAVLRDLGAASVERARLPPEYRKEMRCTEKNSVMALTNVVTWGSTKREAIYRARKWLVEGLPRRKLV